MYTGTVFIWCTVCYWRSWAANVCLHVAGALRDVWIYDGYMWSVWSDSLETRGECCYYVADVFFLKTKMLTATQPSAQANIHWQCKFSRASIECLNINLVSTESLLLCPRPIGGGALSGHRRPSSVCLSDVAYIGSNSKTERPRKTRLCTGLKCWRDSFSWYDQ